MRHLTDTEHLARLSCACQRNIDTDGADQDALRHLSASRGQQFSDPNLDTPTELQRCGSSRADPKVERGRRASAIASLKLNCWRLISEEALSVRGASNRNCGLKTVLG